MPKRCGFCGEMLDMFEDGTEIQKILMCDSCAKKFRTSVKELGEAVRQGDVSVAEKAVEQIDTIIEQSNMKAPAKKAASEKAHDMASQISDTFSADSNQQGNHFQSNSSDDGLLDKWQHESRFSIASGLLRPYVVLQVTLKEKFLGTGSGNLIDLQDVINKQVAKGYRLHTMSTSNGGSKGLAGGDRIQATLVFERLDIANGTYRP